MKKLSDKAYEIPIDIECYIGNDDFFLESIQKTLIFRISKEDYSNNLRVSNRSYRKLLNKISGHFGVKLKDIYFNYIITFENDLYITMPIKCFIYTNLKAERRNKLKKILN